MRKSYFQIVVCSLLMLITAFVFAENEKTADDL